MRCNHLALAGLTAAAVLQVAAAQVAPGVSMAITNASGVEAGYMCEPFQCAPHDMAVSGGQALGVEIFGFATQPYLFFAGPPAPTCYALPWVLGELAMDLPVILIEAGFVPATGMNSKCGVDRIATKLELPDSVPLGAQLVLQVAAFPDAAGVPAFSRAVLLTVF